jgi:hypothetical protein
MNLVGVEYKAVSYLLQGAPPKQLKPSLTPLKSIDM